MNRSSPEFSFTQMSLERASTQRKSDKWLLSQLSKDDCQIIPAWKGRFFIKNGTLQTLYGESKCKVLTSQLTVKAKEYQLVFLGLNDTSPLFSIDISCLEEEQANELFDDSIEWVDLRVALSLLEKEQSSLLGYATSLLHWNKSNRFCGYCGATTQVNSGGHAITCTNNECNKEVFPRTDPVVIMLVEYKPANAPVQCLLGEHQRSNEKCFSTLAGFVDPTETLEQAVIREVKEEAGVDVSNVEYITSQPWPFPSSLMLGFYAKADSPVIEIDEDELRSAKWFTADEIRKFDNWGEEGDNYKLPRKESIARYLIDAWLKVN